MTRPKIVNRSRVEMLLDRGRTYIRGPRNRRCIAEPFTDRAHHCRDHAFRLGLCLGNAVLRERDRSQERSAPGAGNPSP